MRKQKPYSRIPTPALPGSGSRDRTAIRLISAGLHQRPLDCSVILSCRTLSVNRYFPQKEEHPAECSPSVLFSGFLRRRQALFQRRQALLHPPEAAHIRLAKRLLCLL